MEEWLSLKKKLYVKNKKKNMLNQYSLKKTEEKVSKNPFLKEKLGV